MRIALHSHSENPTAEQMKPDYVINSTLTSGSDFAVSYGSGDTFLGCTRKMGHEFFPVIGIDSGLLGFPATVLKDRPADANGQLIPGCRNFIILPIVPHILNIHPLAIADSSMVKLTVESRIECKIIARVYNRKYRVMNSINFNKTISEKPLWGVAPSTNDLYNG